MRVLVLDDDPLTAFTLARLFAIRGIQVVTVSTAEAAGRMIEDERFEAVLVDAQADQAKGLRLLDEARRLDAGISLFVLCDRSPAGREASDIYYIEKPWDGLFVVDIVRARSHAERTQLAQFARGGSHAQDERPTVEMRPKRRDGRVVRESAGPV